MPALWTLTATDLRALLDKGEVSAREVAQDALARVDAVNPAINAIVARMDAEALAAADAVDAARGRGDVPGPLAGVPVTVKVIADQAGHATTNGMRLNAGLIAAEDSAVVANLRRAGAVIIGRTNTPAFSLRWFTRNSLHGATLNPHDAGLTPGGSSGGAGAAVAAGMGPIGHGTDIAGSIRYPAYACGIHGLRPSLGRVPGFNPTAGDRMIGGQLMAVSGPLARSIPDLRLGLQAMAARDPRDPWWEPVPLTGPTYPRRAALIAAPDGMPVDPAITAALQAAARALQDAGWLVDAVEPPPSVLPWREAVSHQLRLWLADYRRTNAAALLAEDDPDALYVYAQLSRHCPLITLNDLMDTMQARARCARLWRVFFDRYPLILCPTSGALPFANNRDTGSEADFDAIMEAQIPMIAPPFMGLPGLSLATGFQGNTPLGIQLLADRFREDILLDAASLLAKTMPAITPKGAA